MNYKLHHIGIATKCMEQTILMLRLFGYSEGDIAFDEAQNVNVCFLTHEANPMIELIGEADDKSPIKNLLKKNGTCIYHVCFEVEDMDSAINKMRKDGYIPTCSKRQSLIDGKEVIFFYHPDSCLIELLDGGCHEA